MERPTKKPTKQKRKPRSCPNPLFLQWLEKWRDEAKSKESKMQYVYSKAVSSLKKYPLPLESGNEATLLDGIGPGIAKRLDEELAKHRKNLANDVVYDVEENIIVNEVSFPDLRVPTPPPLMQPSISSSIGSSSEDGPEAIPKKKRKSSPREYIPLYRSGPYAIILALFKASQRSSYKEYMTKAEIQQQAQPYTETSFTVSEPDSYYTAWSSMSTLVKKGLVTRTGNPARFFLTDSGYIVAEKMVAATGEHRTTPGSPTDSQLTASNARLATSPKCISPLASTKEMIIPSDKVSEKTANSRSTSNQPQPTTRPVTKYSADVIDVTSNSYPDRSKGFLSSYKNKILGTDINMNQSGSLRYWYVDSDGQCVENEDQAAVVIDEAISLGFLIKCKLSDLEKAGMKYKLDPSRSGDGDYVFAYVASDDLTNNIPVENHNATKKKSKVNSGSIACVSDDSDEEMLMRPLFERLTKDPDPCVTITNIKQNTEVKECSTVPRKPDIPVVISELAPATEQPSNQPTQSSSGFESSSSTPRRQVIPEFELKPGSYEIILCVDFVEITGGGKTVRKEEMVKELKMNGVRFDVRKLNVGDFLWIAQERIFPVPGQLVLPERRELVLDYIVERKRMDDLCSSIKDGRFKEQKFRLLNSGLRHPVYLVEDFGSSNFLSLPMQTLEQATINTQVGEGFFVKRTRDIKESAAYLTLMTRYLQTLYNNKTLKAIKKEDMEFVSDDEGQPSTFLMTFQELSDISLKNKILTVGELFGKQLLQIPGVAVEKAISILETYPTLRHLLDAYEELTSEKEKESLLSGLKYGKAQRKIGPSVSKLLYQLYCTKGALL